MLLVLFELLLFYDVVLFDYQLLGINVLEIVKILYDECGFDVLVVLVSGQGSEDVVVEVLCLGVVDYLVKYVGYLNELLVVFEYVYWQVQFLCEQVKLCIMVECLCQLLVVNLIIFYVLWVSGMMLWLYWVSENIMWVYGYLVDECL